MIRKAGLHPRLQQIAKKLPAVCARNGFECKVTSGYRSTQKQKQLYKLFLAGKMPYTVAPPGRSLHEKGLAIDVTSTNTKKLVSLLRKAGLSWAGKTDPVHFSLIPYRDDGSKVKPKKSIFKKVLGLASFIPGPIGWASTAANLVVKR